MAAIAELVTPATVDAVTPKVSPKRSPRKPKVEPVVEAPVVPTLEELETELRTAWDEAHKGETQAKTVLDAAKIAWANTRVLKCRIAFKAAMLTPNAEGKANLLNATRILGTDPEADKGARTKAAKSRKNSLRKYVEAGVALDAEGMANRITEPDADERKIVADVFSAKEEVTPPAGGTEGGEGESEADTDVDAVAMGVVDIIGHIARMQASFKLIKETSKVISESEAGKVAEMLAEFSTQLSAYAEGK